MDDGHTRLGPLRSDTSKIKKQNFFQSNYTVFYKTVIMILRFYTQVNVKKGKKFLSTPVI